MLLLLLAPSCTKSARGPQVVDHCYRPTCTSAWPAFISLFQSHKMLSGRTLLIICVFASILVLGILVSFATLWVNFRNKKTSNTWQSIRCKPYLEVLVVNVDIQRLHVSFTKLQKPFILSITNISSKGFINFCFRFCLKRISLVVYSRFLLSSWVEWIPKPFLSVAGRITRALFIKANTHLLSSASFLYFWFFWIQMFV